MTALEDQLRATLHRHAATTPISARPFDVDEVPAPIVRLVSPQRLRRRRTLVVAVGVMAAAAVGAFVVINAQHPGEEQAPKPANPGVDSTPAVLAVVPDPEPLTTDTPAEALDTTRSPDAVKYLPGVLPDGTRIWSINSFDSNGFTSRPTTQRWRNEADGEISLRFDGSTAQWSDFVETGNGWRISWGDYDQSAPTAFGASDRDSNLAFGESKLVSRDTIIDFLETVSIRDAGDPMAGYDSSDPTWTLLDDHRGTPGNVPLGWSLDVRIGDTLDHATYGGGPHLMLSSQSGAEPWARADSEIRQLADGTDAYFTDGSLEWVIDGRPFSLSGAFDLDTMLAVASSVHAVSDAEWNAALDDISAGGPVDLDHLPDTAGLKYLPTRLPDGYAIWHLEHHPASHSYTDAAGRGLVPTLFTGVAMGTALDTSYDGEGIQFWVEDVVWPEPPTGGVRRTVDGSNQEYFVIDDGSIEVVWKRDGNTLRLRGNVDAAVLLDMADSVQAVTEAEWAAAQDALTIRLTPGGPPLAEGLAGDVAVSLYTDDIICGQWPDGLRRCQNLRAGSNSWSMVVEREERFEAVGSWPTTGELTTTAGVTIDQVQVGAVRFFHVVLPPAGGLTIETGDGSGFSVNLEG